MIPLHIVADWLEEHGPPGMAEAVRSGVIRMPVADLFFLQRDRGGAPVASAQWGGARAPLDPPSGITGEVIGSEVIPGAGRIFLVRMHGGPRFLFGVGPGTDAGAFDVDPDGLPPMPPEFRQAPAPAPEPAP
jgi:hypothetical protein